MLNSAKIILADQRKCAISEKKKNKVKVGAQAPPLDPPLDNENKTNNGRKSQINTNKIPNNR